MIPDDVIDEVRARADIVDIISEIVPLKKAGREYKANCPFHEERTPSFCVVPDKGFFKCFGCGKSGDVFGFVMERQGMDFVDAVKYVAARSGVEVREVRRGREEDDPNRPLYELNAFARSWFSERLADGEGGAKARKYLDGRGIGAAAVERFGLGFAPDEWRAFREAAGRHGFDDDAMLQLGLLRQSDRSKEPYDGFRSRIMFPIESLGGKVVGFGGRILEGAGNDGPKYINSPETPIYQKGQTLYGLSWAKNHIRKEAVAIVVEGYLDVVSLAASGFENVVAPLGTAVTPDQAQLLSRYCTRVLLLFDSDAAGLRATFKAGDILLSAGLHPAVVSMPEGEDPDTLVRSAGPDALKSLLDDAVDVLDRKLQILDQRDHFSSIERTRAAVDRLLPTLRAARDPALRDIYVSKVADRTGVRRETLEGELRRAQPAASSAYLSAAPTPRHPRVRSGGAESQLLKIMVRGVEWVERTAELISPEDFDDPSHRAIFEALLDDPEVRAPPASMDLVAAKRFDEILDDREELAHGVDVFTNSINRIRVLALDRRIQDLQRRIEAADGDDEKLELTAEKARWASELRELDPNYWASATRRVPVKPNPNEANS